MYIEHVFSNKLLGMAREVFILGDGYIVIEINFQIKGETQVLPIPNVKC